MKIDKIDTIELRNIVLNYMLNGKFGFAKYADSLRFGAWTAIKKACLYKGINNLTEEDYYKCVDILKKFDCFEFDEDPLSSHLRIVKIPLDYMKIDKKMVKDAVLNYMEEKEISSMSVGSIQNAIEKELFVGTKYIGLSSFVLDECIEKLKEFDCFEFNDGKITYKETLKERLQNKFNIVIDTIKDNIGVIVVVASAVVFVGGYAGLIINGINLNEKYENSIVVDSDKEYSMKDIYVVYSVDEVHFCTRSIHKITEDDKIHGKFARGYGSIDEYYYRDEIYDYYDIKTGNKICEDHQDGFYIEGLMNFYGNFDMKDRGYKIGIDEITNDIDNDYLLSREPEMRRK